MKTRTEMMKYFERIVNGNPLAGVKEKEAQLEQLKALSDEQLAVHYALHHENPTKPARFFIPLDRQERLALLREQAQRHLERLRKEAQERLSVSEKRAEEKIAEARNKREQARKRAAEARKKLEEL